MIEGFMKLSETVFSLLVFSPPTAFPQTVVAPDRSRSRSFPPDLFGPDRSSRLRSLRPQSFRSRPLLPLVFLPPTFAPPTALVPGLLPHAPFASDPSYSAGSFSPPLSSLPGLGSVKQFRAWGLRFFQVPFLHACCKSLGFGAQGSFRSRFLTPFGRV